MRRIWATAYQRPDRGNEWWVRFRDHNGKEHRKRIAPDTAEGKKLARQWAAKYELDYLKSEMGFTTGEILLEDFFARYLAQARLENSASYVQRVEGIWSSFLKYLSENHLEIRKLQHLNKEIFLDYQRYRSNCSTRQTRKLLTRKTVNFEMSTLSTLMRRAVEWDLLKSNPCQVRHLKQVDSKKVRALTEQEIRLVLDTVKRENSWLRGPVMIGYYAGLRRGEVRWLEWSDIDFQFEVIHIQRKDRWIPKSCAGEIREREVFMAFEFKNFLLRHRLTRSDKDNWVFHGPKNGQLAKSFGQAFRRLCRRLEIQGVTEFHALRHSFGSHLARRNVPLHIIKELMGHKSIKTTQRYLTPFEEEMRTGVNTLNLDVDTVFLSSRISG